MSCLGERLTALVDGELEHDERDRVLAHLAGCAPCRAEADTLRRLKNRLRGLGGLPPVETGDTLPTSDFMTRLRSMGEPEAPVRAPAPRRPAAPQPRVGRPRDNRPAARASATRRAAAAVAPGRRCLAVGAATLMLGLGAASYAAGGREDEPSVSPAFEQFAVEHALTTGDVPMTDPVDDPAPVPVAPEP
ncbi:anti-sigma factor family protein [Spirillospora sp. CA-294931]|uniref:anti-sigma factor family protein n=1 Tax=Spirillospora sp. CA-294931 TaxID=3240042 RepID=UPI003D89FCD0